MSNELRDKLIFQLRLAGRVWAHIDDPETTVVDYLMPLISASSLSQSSGVEAVRTCDCGGGRGFACYHCLKCNMTGEIVRELTVGEVVALAKNGIRIGEQLAVLVPIGTHLRVKP